MPRFHPYLVQPNLNKSYSSTAVQERKVPGRQEVAATQQGHDQLQEELPVHPPERHNFTSDTVLVVNLDFVDNK